MVAEGPDRSKSRTSCSALVIPAAGAFGTGEHSTTAMTLRLLEETTRDFRAGWRLLDAGTGSGILALAARRFGAFETLGLDNDSRAVMNARRNAQLNHIARARFIVADILRFKPQNRYEVITANLFSELLIAVLPVFRRGLKAEGLLIISGILREQADSVLTALVCAGFDLEKKRRRGKWLALQARAGRKQGAAASSAVKRKS
jgi:ribosomal protein L11 methyltransferase